MISQHILQMNMISWWCNPLSYEPLTTCSCFNRVQSLQIVLSVSPQRRFSRMSRNPSRSVDIHEIRWNIFVFELYPQCFDFAVQFTVLVLQSCVLVDEILVLSMELVELISQSVDLRVVLTPTSIGSFPPSFFEISTIRQMWRLWTSNHHCRWGQPGIL